MKTDIGPHLSKAFPLSRVAGLQSRRRHSDNLGKFGAANRGRRLTDQERAEAVKQMRAEGRLGREVR